MEQVCDIPSRTHTETQMVTTLLTPPRQAEDSANESFQSLSSLDEEAQMCGLELREVREAVMNRSSHVNKEGWYL